MPELSITDLIERLEELRDQLGEDVDVRIVYQPSYPLRVTVAAVVSSDDILRTEAEFDGEDADEALAAAQAEADDGTTPKIVWLAAGDSVGYRESPYGPRSAWSATGW